MAGGITRIAVEGFKSIAKRQEIEIAPLTILAGANSSGKSSIMQPLLMLKQTLEVTYDPGPLKIDGPNASFSKSEEFLSRGEQNPARELHLDISVPAYGFDFTFAKAEQGLVLTRQTHRLRGESLTLRPEMSPSEAQEAAKGFGPTKPFAIEKLSVTQNRFLLSLMMADPPYPVSLLSPAPLIQSVIHVPALRGNPARVYPAAGSGPNFPGLFHHYVASTILAWQKDSSCRNDELTADLQRIGLALDVFAHRVNDVAIEIYVQLVKERSDNIADVGFGVSQLLPVLVALRAAGGWRLVYLEEPEVNLHPLAQTKLAKILADAAKREVRVVVETHSTLLLTAIQTLVAKGELSPELVKLHWFQRDPHTGITQVTSADLDENGAFGEWPEDFDRVILDTDRAYLDAVEDRQVR